MKLLNALAIEHDAKTISLRAELEIPLNLTGKIAQESFKAGFITARKMAGDIWKHSDHIYCDFYYEGGTKLSLLGEEEI